MTLQIETVTVAETEVNLVVNHCSWKERQIERLRETEEEVALCNPERPPNGNLSFRCSILSQKKIRDREKEGRKIYRVKLSVEHTSLLTLEVDTRVYYFLGLNGSCSSAHQPKGLLQ